MQEDLLVQITNKLKDIRKEKNLTLQELADATGVTKSMLSQVENNRTIPSLTVFLNIIKSLRIDINEFFTNFAAQGNRVIFKKAHQYHRFEKENTAGFRYERILSSAVQDFHIDFVLLTLSPGARREPVQTDAYEFKYLLSGEVEYTVGNEQFDMKAGDSIFFDATEPHTPRNLGSEQAQLLVVYFFKNGE